MRVLGVVLVIMTISSVSVLAQQPYIVNDEYTGKLQVFVEPQQAHELHMQLLQQMIEAGHQRVHETTECSQSDGSLMQSMDTEVTMSSIKSALSFIKDEQLWGVERDDRGRVQSYTYTDIDPADHSYRDRTARVSYPNNGRHLNIYTPASDNLPQYRFMLYNDQHGKVKWMEERGSMYWKESYTYDDDDRVILIERVSVSGEDTVRSRTVREYDEAGFVVAERMYGSERLLSCAAMSVTLDDAVQPDKDGLFLYQIKRYRYE